MVWQGKAEGSNPQPQADLPSFCPLYSIQATNLSDGATHSQGRGPLIPASQILIQAPLRFPTYDCLRLWGPSRHKL